MRRERTDLDVWIGGGAAGAIGVLPDACRQRTAPVRVAAHIHPHRVRAFRGLALADRHAPFVVVNDQDARTAWSFTLLHEACHIWLGESGVSAMQSDFVSERFCNEVASAFLLPQAELAEVSDDLTASPTTELAQRISQFAARRNLSSTLVAYRFFVSGRIAEVQWTALEDHFRNEWRRQREQQKLDKSRSKKDTGPSYYVVKRHRLGDALISAASRGMLEGTLTATKAGIILGVAPRNVYPLLAPANGRAAS